MAQLNELGKIMRTKLTGIDIIQNRRKGTIVPLRTVESAAKWLRKNKKNNENKN